MFSNDYINRSFLGSYQQPFLEVVAWPFNKWSYVKAFLLWIKRETIYEIYYDFNHNKYTEAKIYSIKTFWRCFKDESALAIDK